MTFGERGSILIPSKVEKKPEESNLPVFDLNKLCKQYLLIIIDKK